MGKSPRRLLPEQIRQAWGADCFVPVPRELVKLFEFSAQDATLLTEIGLPVAPRAAFAFELRFESVQQFIDPLGLKFLHATTFERGTSYPITGDTFQDSWVRLDRCVVLGKVKRVPEPEKPAQLSRYLCVDPEIGRVCWVSATLVHRRVHIELLNSSLHAYLACLLAYKQFRAKWPALDELLLKEGAAADEADYQAFTRSIHAEFIEALHDADPAAFGYFWEGHAWNEAILIELEWHSRRTEGRA